MNDDRNREEKEKKKKTEKKKEKTPLVSLPPSSSKRRGEGEEEEEEEEEGGGGGAGRSLSRLGSAFDMIQSQIIDPADMLLTRKMVIKKNVDEDNVRGSSRELLQSSRGREVLKKERKKCEARSEKFHRNGRITDEEEKQQHQTHQNDQHRAVR